MLARGSGGECAAAGRGHCASVWRARGVRAMWRAHAATAFRQWMRCAPPRGASEAASSTGATGPRCACLCACACTRCSQQPAVPRRHPISVKQPCTRQKIAPAYVLGGDPSEFSPVVRGRTPGPVRTVFLTSWDPPTSPSPRPLPLERAEAHHPGGAAQPFVTSLNAA